MSFTIEEADWDVAVRAKLMALRRYTGRRVRPAMRTYPIRDDGGVLFAFEVDAQPFGRRLVRVLLQIDGVTDVRPRRNWTGSPDVHIRFLYRGREYVVWEPVGDNSRWWIGPDDTDTKHLPLDELERAIGGA